MKYQYRVTKYDPANRNELGHYTKNEWTAFCDIGKEFADRVLTSEEYEKVESRYIEAIFSFMACMQLDSLQLSTVWNGYKYKESGLQLKNGAAYSGEKLKRVIQFTLREKIGCHLVSESSMFVHFGYDYYMYIGTTNDCISAVERVRNNGMFSEDFGSPYGASE